MLLTLDGDGEKTEKSFKLGRKKKRRNTAHPLRHSFEPREDECRSSLSLLSDEYHLQTKSKQISLQSFVEEAQIVNADFEKKREQQLHFWVAVAMHLNKVLFYNLITSYVDWFEMIQQYSILIASL